MAIQTSDLPSILPGLPLSGKRRGSPKPAFAHTGHDNAYAPPDPSRPHAQASSHEYPGIEAAVDGKLTSPTPNVRQGWRELLSSLPVKLIAPYLVVTLATALVGMFVITRLVTSSLRERFVNQLLEVSRVAADGIVSREEHHLEQIRPMAYTRGVAEAIASRDTQRLQDLLFPLVSNGHVQSLSIVDAYGHELLSMIQDPESGRYNLSQGGDLSRLDLVRKPLSGSADQLGDKFAAIVSTIYGPFLMTSAPVRLSDSTLVGVLVLGTRLDTLAADLKRQSMADLVIFDPLGQLMASTLPASDQSSIDSLSTFDIAYLDPAQTRELTLNDRQYQALYAPLIIRQEPVGVLGVVLPSSFVVATEATSRNIFSLLFSAATLAVIIVGYLLSRRVSKPILRIRDAALAVASGDLEQRTGVQGRDEVGQMAAVFDLMTFRLRRRTAQAKRLYAESLQRSEELAGANTRLQQTQQQLVQSEKLAAVGQLTAGIVHDVKNPLAVIRGLAEEAQGGIPEDSDMRPLLAQIRDNAGRANAIVSDLLKFARQSPVAPTTQDICDTIQIVVRLTDFMARKGKVKVTTYFDACPAMVTYDARQIEQVMVNLIQNAIQAMPNGGTLTLSVTDEDGWIVLSVRDTGIGIPAKHLGRIFDPFFTTKLEGEGTGLGLSVSHGIVAQHRGQITVQSAEGRGTTFTIRLPKAAARSGQG